MGTQQVAIQWLRLRGEEEKFVFFLLVFEFLCVRIHDTRRFDAGTYYVVRWRRMLNRYESISRSLPLPVVAAVMNLNFKWQVSFWPNVPWPTGSTSETPVALDSRWIYCWIFLVNEQVKGGFCCLINDFLSANKLQRLGSGRSAFPVRRVWSAAKS